MHDLLRVRIKNGILPQGSRFVGICETFPGTVPPHSLPTTSQFILMVWQSQGGSHGFACMIPQLKNEPYEETHSLFSILGISSWFWPILDMWAAYPSSSSQILELPLTILLNSPCSLLHNMFEVWLFTHYFCSSQWIWHDGNASNQASWETKQNKTNPMYFENLRHSTIHF